MGRGTGSNIPECIEMTQQPLQLNSPPQRYTYPILPGGLPSNVGGNLVQMSIAANSGQTINNMGSNGGYRGDTFNVLQSRIEIYKDQANNLKIPNIPNPLKILEEGGLGASIDGRYYAIPQQYLQGTSVSGSKLAICTPGLIEVGTTSNSTSLDNCPSIASPSVFNKTNDTTKAVANLNIKDWNDYLGMDEGSGLYKPKAKLYVGEDEAEVRALFARFVLCDLVGNIDLNTWVYDKEYIKYMDDDNKQIIMLASAANNDNKYKNHIYKYKSLGGNTNYVNGFTGAGSINGYIGVIDNKQYRFQKFMRSYGFYIIIGILGLVFLYSVGSTFLKKSKPGTSN